MANLSIKDTIDANIDDLREKIETQAKTVKNMLREALAFNRLPQEEQLGQQPQKEQFAHVTTNF